MARFKVTFAGPLVSFQDAGRHGHLRYGVSHSGPMDRLSHAACFAMLGYEDTSTCIEISLGGLVLECLEGETTVSLAGGHFNTSLNDQSMDGWNVATVRQGDKLTVRAGAWGSWTYLAFCGDLCAETWLGATSTHSMSGFGGGALKAGTEFVVQNSKVLADRVGAYPCPDIAMPAQKSRVVIGPQDQHFDPVSVSVLSQEAFALTDAFDRMGVRLDGPKLILRDALSIPSEPILRGSIQVSGDGIPTVLLSDHQTTGGYPKIGTVISPDLDTLSQMRAGDQIQFQTLEPQKAVRTSREHNQLFQTALSDLRAPRATLSEKLMDNNLIGGMVFAEP